MTDILDGFDQLSDQLEQDRTVKLRAARLATSGLDPEAAAKANALADRRGLPFEAAADALPDLEAEDRLERIAAVGSRAPAVGDFLTDPRRMALAGDEAEGLERLAGALAQREPSWQQRLLGDVLQAGVGLYGNLSRTLTGRTTGEDVQGTADVGRSVPAGAIRGVGGTVAGLGELYNLGERTVQRGLDAIGLDYRFDREDVPIFLRPGDSFAQTGQAIKGGADVVGVPAERQNTATGIAEGVGQIGVMAAQAVVAPQTLAPTTVALGADQMAEAVRAADAYGTGRGDIAISTGAAAIGALERLGLEGIVNRLPPRVRDPFYRFIADTALAGAAEGTTEAAQQVAQNVIIQQTVDADQAIGEGVLDSGTQGAGAAAIVRALLGLPGVPRSQTRRAAEELQRVIVSGEANEQLRAATDLAAELKLGERSPADLAAFVANVAGEDARVYLPADQARVLFQSEALVELVGSEEALAEQMASGDLAIPLANWMATVPRLPNREEILRHARTSPDGLSPAELEAFDPDAVAAELGAEDTGEAADREEPSQPSGEQQVVDDVMAQLMGTRRYTDAAAEAQAKLWGAAFARFGQSSGQDPFALYQRYMAGIGNAQPDPRSRRPWMGSGRLDAIIESIRTPDSARASEIYGPSLSSWLVGQGGLRDSGGELRARDAGRIRPGLVSGTGLELDRARELAVEAGYLPDGADLNAFIDALDSDLRGTPVYSEQQGSAARQEFEAQRQEVLQAIADTPELRDMPAEEFSALTNQQIAERLFGSSVFDQPAYHGTPHTVDRFSLQAIGTGEGNQTFGWGLYFASQRDIADHYRRTLTGIAKMPGAQAAEDMLRKTGGDRAEAIRLLKRKGDEAAVEFLRRDPNRGNLYQVEVPEDGDLLDWDKPMSEQPEKVLQALSKETGVPVERYRESSRTGKQIYNTFVSRRGSPEEASRRLAEIGIPGLRYLDGASRGQGDGSHNYVIWDEAAISEPARLFQSAAILYQSAAPSVEAFRGMSREEFLGSPRITSNANASDLRPRALADTMEAPAVPFLNGLTARFSESGAAVFDGDKVVASYNFGDTLVVDKKYRRRGIGEELVYQWRTRNPDAKPARERTKASQALQERVWDRIQRELHGGDPRSLFQRAAEAVMGLFQRKPTDGPRGQIEIFPDRRMAISLFESADRSTFLHESGHFFLEVFRDIAAQEDAPQQVKDDFAKLLEWFGVESAYQIGTEQHEQFARGFEHYLAEGKAPSAELQSVFSQFKAWLLAIYRTLTNLNVQLSDDVRGVFDRMLASEDEIDAAQARTGWRPLAADAKEAAALGLTEKQFADYQAMVQAASEEAKAEVMAKLETAHRRELARWWKEEQAKVRAEVESEYEAMPVFRAARILQGAQKMADGSPVPEELAGLKLDRTALVEVYGEAYLKRLGRVYAREGGVDQDTAAARLGFSSGDALVVALANRGDMAARIDAEVKQRMMDRHGDPLNDGTLPQTAMDAVHNNRRVQVLERELAMLADLAREPRPNLRAMKAAAEALVARKTSRQIRPAEHLAAERRAASEATKAAAAGDYAAALQAKRRQAFNSAMYRAARDAQERAESTIRYLRKAASDKTRERVGKQAGKFYVDALDAIFDGLEVRQASGRQVARRGALRDWVRRMQEAGNNTAVPEHLLARVESEAVTNVADLTMEQLAEVREAVENLLHLARVKNRLRTAQGERDWDEAKADLIERLSQQEARHGRDGVSKADRDLFRTISDAYAAGANWVLQPETLIEWLDDGTSGPFHELLWEPSEAAEHTRERLSRMVGAKLQEALAQLPDAERKALDRRYRIESLDAEVSGHSILSALLNMGNAGNRDKLLRGGRVVGDQTQPFTEEQLAEMFSRLSAPQAQLVQGVWDAVDLLWPEIVKLEEDLNGIAPPRVEATPFTVVTKDGPVPLRGGYYPVMYDPAGARAGRMAEDEQAQRVLSGQTPVRASTSKGHTEARTDYVAPLLLDYQAVLTRHLDGVMSDIAYRQFLQQAYRILGDADISRMIDNRVGPGAARGLQKAFERGAVGNFSLAGPFFGPFQKAADATMTNLSAAALGFRVPLALANVVTAPVLAAARVKPKFLFKGLADYYIGNGPNFVRNMRTQAEAIHRLSPMMLRRSEARSIELSAMISNLRGKRGLRAKMIELSMSVHQWIVPLAENAIWLGAYKQAQAEGAGIAEAVRMADKAIRQTQTKHTAKDLAQAEGGYMRPLMMFAGPLVIINNRLQEAGLRGLRGDVKSRTQAIGVWLAMAAGGAWMFELMMGRWPDDEDDDGDVDIADWMRWAAKKLALLPLSAFPVIRDAATFADSGMARPLPLTDAINQQIKFGKDVGEQVFGEEEVDPARLIKGATRAAGAVSGIPSNQMIRSGEDLVSIAIDGRELQNPAAEAYYLMQGPPDEE